MKKLIACLLLCGTAGLAQTAPPTWFKVSAGGDTITAAKGTTLRYGMTASTYVFDYAGHKPGEPSPEGWSPAVTTQADSSFVGDETFFGVDPLVDVYKEVDVQETAAAQVITVKPADGSAAYTKIIPALSSIEVPVWTGPRMECWQQSAIERKADGTAGQTYLMTICTMPK